jgi:hypothetical protein
MGVNSIGGNYSLSSLVSGQSSVASNPQISSGPSQPAELNARSSTDQAEQSQVVAQGSDSQSASSASLVGQLRAQLVQTPSRIVAPQKPEHTRLERQTVPNKTVIHHPSPRREQTGYRNESESVAGQYAAIYNSTAVALSRASIQPMATERAQVATERPQLISQRV